MKRPLIVFILFILFGYINAQNKKLEGFWILKKVNIQFHDNNIDSFGKRVFIEEFRKTEQKSYLNLKPDGKYELGLLNNDTISKSGTWNKSEIGDSLITNDLNMSISRTLFILNGDELKIIDDDTVAKLEMIYFLDAIKPSTEWFLNNVARKNPEKKIIVLTNCLDEVKYYCSKDKNISVGYTRYYERSEKKWDYCIFFEPYLNPKRILIGKFPPFGTIYTCNIAGMPKGFVIKRESIEDYEGFQADRAKNFRLSADKYLSYLKKDSNNNAVYFYLSSAYANLGKLDSAILAANISVEGNPEFSAGYYALNQYYNGKKDYDNAAKVMTQYLEARPKDADAWLMKGQALGQKGDYTGALECAHTGISISPQDIRFYELGAAVYQAQKDNINLSLYVDAMQAFKGKDAKAQQKGLESMQAIYLGITGKELDLGGQK